MEGIVKNLMLKEVAGTLVHLIDESKIFSLGQIELGRLLLCFHACLHGGDPNIE